MLALCPTPSSRWTIRRSAREGVADATIASRAFELAVPDTGNYGYYMEIALYINEGA
jgi:hypothetical protein